MSNRPAPPPGFTLNGDDDEDRPPAPPPGFQIVDAGRPSPPRSPAIGDIGAVTGAHDGDTLTTSSGRNVRLWGVDAPELRQQGWDRTGQAVAIGQHSLADLNEALARARASVGVPVSQSYGRPVAPVTLGGVDLGQTLARQGDALAAPDYLKADPERRFRYMQAERLARLNRLGVHDTFHQSAADYRKSPMPAPERETVAQFFDTPTPMAGMRPEAEQEYIRLINDFSVDPVQVAAFARENGFTVDPRRVAEVREWAREHNQPVEFVYQQAPKPLTDLGDGATGAAVRGAGSGVLAGGLDELGAFADMAGLTPGRENVWNSDRRLADIWQNNQQQNAAILGFDKFAHPYAELGGELAGGLIVPFGAKARTVPQLFRVGAAYGGLEGFLGTDGGVGERAIGGAVGVPLGGLVGAGAGKALEFGLRAAPRVAERVGLSFPRHASVGAEGVSGGNFEAIPPRTRDIIDIGEVPLPPPGYSVDAPDAPDFGPLDTRYPGPVDMRDRDWIDISQIPEPPAGFRLDQPRTSGNLAMAMDAEPSTSLSQALPRERDYLDMGGVRPVRLSDPLTAGQMRAVANDVTPSDVLPIPSNMVGDIDEVAAIDAGRFAPARAPNERGELTRRTVRTWNGAELPKAGPIDMVGWLRLNGGLADQGGELSHMGLNNRGRSLDFAGQESRFGPLVNNTDGMTLDDAAMRAWEAGYFPDHAERPSVNEFLDALRDTHEGRNRRFLPEDYPEIDRFEAARQERHDLEQRRFEAGEPIYHDRSVPAGEDMPIPPVQAYEEWPAGGPDFAGNVNLSKLDSPQDIKRALDYSYRRIGGFDAATRGRVTWVETERLASDLGMTPDTLLARRKGQPFNAEEALAARQILAKSGNELVNAAKRIRSMDEPGDDVMADFRQKWMRHAAIQEQIAGMTAEAGRALQQFRMMANSRAVPRDVLTAMVQSGGGRRRLQDAADILLDAVEESPGKFNALVEKAAKPKFSDKLVELWINSLLTNPATHMVNIVSNTLTSLGQLPEHAAAAAIGKGRQMLPGANTDRVIGSEIGARAFGLLQGAKEGARFFAQALRTGEPADVVSKVENQDMKAISGLKGEIVRMPTRFLTAEDELFKGIARRMSLNGLAVRQARRDGLRGDAAKARIAELSANPTDEMLAQSMDYARYLTFQQKLGPFASGISRQTQVWPSLKLFLPFVRTPTNLLKFAIERSPAAPLLKEWRADFRAGGARRDLALAKAMVGTGFGAAMYEAALNGQITGSTPGDPKKARLLYADGWQPYSIRLGDKWYSYKRLDPFSTTIGTAADLALLPEGMSQRQREDMVTLFTASILGNLASKTWLSGVSDLVSAFAEPEMNADRLIQQLAGSIAVPAGVAGIARIVDPVMRETETVADAVRARIPGLSSSLPPRRDVWGAPIVNEGGVGPDIVSPIWQSAIKDDPVNREMMAIGYAPGNVRREVGGRELTPQEYDRYQEAAGKRTYQAIQKLIASPGWMDMDLEAREKAASKAAGTAREEARAALFGARRRGSGRGAPPPPPGFTPDGNAPPPPAGYTMEGAAAGRNVYADLQQAIPGVRFTSGYRTPEYQASMRRRGYRPAYNSHHLDGSALDMLPPPGKSMGWLREQVRRYDPKARLLIHDGHLHATFPGYFGAPVLGGARGAGLENPNAGMPPPPPGFKIN